MKDYVERRVLPLILVPLIQGTIFYLDHNAPATAYVMGLSLFPFLAKVDPMLALTIESGTAWKEETISGAAAMEAFSGDVRT